MEDRELLEHAVKKAVNGLLSSFPSGNCSSCFKVPTAYGDGTAAIAVRDGQEEYIMSLSLMRGACGENVRISMCCLARGNERKIRRYLQDGETVQELTCKLLELLRN